MFILEDVQPGKLIKKAKERVPFHRYKEQAEEVIRKLRESGVEVQLVGSYGALEKIEKILKRCIIIWISL